MEKSSVAADAQGQAGAEIAGRIKQFGDRHGVAEHSAEIIGVGMLYGQRHSLGTAKRAEQPAQSVGVLILIGVAEYGYFHWAIWYMDWLCI